MSLAGTIEESLSRQESLLESFEHQYSYAADVSNRSELLRQRTLLLSTNIISSIEELACLVEYMEKSGLLYEVFPDDKQRAGLQIYRTRLIAGRGMEGRLRNLEKQFIYNTGVDIFGIFGVRGSKFAKNTYPLLRKILKAVKVQFASRSSRSDDDDDDDYNDHDDIEDDDEDKDSDWRLSVYWVKNTPVREKIIELLSEYVQYKGWNDERRGLDKNLLMQYLTSAPKMQSLVDWLMMKPWWLQEDTLRVNKVNFATPDWKRNVTSRSKSKRHRSTEAEVENASEIKRKKTNVENLMYEEDGNGDEGNKDKDSYTIRTSIPSSPNRCDKPDERQRKQSKHIDTKNEITPSTLFALDNAGPESPSLPDPVRDSYIVSTDGDTISEPGDKVPTSPLINPDLDSRPINQEEYDGDIEYPRSTGPNERESISPERLMEQDISENDTFIGLFPSSSGEVIDDMGKIESDTERMLEADVSSTFPQSRPQEYEDCYSDEVGSREITAITFTTSGHVSLSGAQNTWDDEQGFVLSGSQISIEEQRPHTNKNYGQRDDLEHNPSHHPSPSGSKLSQANVDSNVHLIHNDKYKNEREDFVTWVNKIWELKRRLLKKLYTTEDAIVGKSAEMVKMETQLKKYKTEGMAVLDGAGVVVYGKDGYDDVSRGEGALQRCDWEKIFQGVNQCVSGIGRLEKEVRQIVEKKKRIGEDLNRVRGCLARVLEEVGDILEERAEGI